MKPELAQALAVLTDLVIENRGLLGVHQVALATVTEALGELDKAQAAIRLLLQYKALRRAMPLSWLEAEFGSSQREAVGAPSIPMGDATNRAINELMAASVAVVVGSVWRENSNGSKESIVTDVDTACHKGNPIRIQRPGVIHYIDEDGLREQYTWLRDPAPSEPSKVCGTVSRSGRMSCTEMAGHDGPCADHGDVFAIAEPSKGDES